MKRIFLGLTLAGVASVANAQTGKLQVKVNIENIGDSLIVYYQQKRDTITGTDGKFEFTLDASDKGMFLAATPATFRGKDNKYFQMVAIPDETLEVTGSLPKSETNDSVISLSGVSDKLTFAGSKFYTEYTDVMAQNRAAIKELTDYNQTMLARIQGGESQEAVLAEYHEHVGPLKEKAENGIMDVLRKNSDKEASAYLISSFDTAEKIEAAIALLSDGVKNGRMKDIVYQTLNQSKAQAENEAKAAKVQGEGVESQDFTLTDINGKNLTLSSLRGKYVILDFWGSWCGWCIKGMPKMKEYYDKYKGKMEIVGVDSGDTDEKWKEAVKKHELPWLHVKDAEGDDSVVKKYAVSGFPTKILVGPDGKIVKTIVGEDPQFYTFLDDTFSK